MLISACAALTAAACSEKSADKSGRTMPTVDAKNYAMAGVTGRGIGIVTAVDPAAGAVTIKHGPIPRASTYADDVAIRG